MSGVVVAVRPPTRVSPPGRSLLRGSGSGLSSRWVLAVGCVAVVLAAGTTATAVTASAAAAVHPPSPVMACSAGAVAGLTAEQRRNAATIVAVGQAAGVSQRGQIVALATAMQESRLVNVNYGDRDSLGLFQQRPSQGWGTPAQVTDPVYAARTFYRHLLAIPGWERLPVTVAAQTVQRSAFPAAYAKWESQSVQLVTGTTCAKK